MGHGRGSEKEGTLWIKDLLWLFILGQLLYLSVTSSNTDSQPLVENGLLILCIIQENNQMFLIGKSCVSLDLCILCIINCQQRKVRRVGYLQETLTRRAVLSKLKKDAAIESSKML